MFTRHMLAATAALSLLGHTALAHDYKAGDLTIDHPYSIATAEAAMSGAGYLTITNAASEPDRLMGVVADFPRVELHITEVGADGVARMVQQAGGLEIPAGGALALEPQGAHIMFMGLTEPLVEGGKIAATLIFEKAGAVDVEFNVEARGDGEADGHAGHSGH